MKKPNLSISVKLILCFSAILIFFTLCFYSFQFLPAIQKLTDMAFKEKLNTIAGIYQTSLSNAMKNYDDIALLSSIESVMKFEGVYTAYLLDKTGKVLTGDKTTEWGKTYTDKISKNIVKSTKRLLQPTSKPDEMLFSLPVTSSTTLAVGISNEKNSKLLGSLGGNFFYSSLVLLCLAIIATVYIIINTIHKRSKELRHYLNSLSLSKQGQIPDMGKDEFGKIASDVNRLITSYESSKTSRFDDLAKTHEKAFLLLKQFGDHFTSGIMLIDSENKIILANDKLLDFFSLKSDVTGKHLLDISKPELLNLVKKSSENHNFPVSETFSGKKVSAVTVSGHDKTSCGVVILLE